MLFNILHDRGRKVILKNYFSTDFQNELLDGFQNRMLRSESVIYRELAKFKYLIFDASPFKNKIMVYLK